METETVLHGEKHRLPSMARSTASMARSIAGLHPRAGWWTLVVTALAWSPCVLLLGIGASTLARSPAQLSAAGDIFALPTTILGGSLVPATPLPSWLHRLAPFPPGYWALDAYRDSLIASPDQLGGPLAMLGVFPPSPRPSRPGGDVVATALRSKDATNDPPTSVRCPSVSAL